MRRVIVAEDNEELLNLLRDEAGEAQVELVTVKTRDELFRYIDSESFSAIVLDLQIPENPGAAPDVEVGLRALEQLSSQGLGPKTLVYSAWDEIANVVAALNTGALFRRKEECSGGKLFQVLSEEIYSNSREEVPRSESSQEQRDLRLTQEILDSKNTGPEVAVTLARTMLQAEDVFVLRVDRKLSVSTEELVLVPFDNSSIGITDTGKVSAELKRTGVLTLAQLCERTRVLKSTGSTRETAIIPLFKRDEPGVYCLAVRAAQRYLKQDAIEHLFETFRLSLWHLLHAEPSSTSGESSLRKMTARFEDLSMGFMSNCIRPAIGLMGLSLATLGVMVGLSSLLAFIPIVFAAFSHGDDDHTHFAVDVLGFVEGIWLAVLLLIFSFGITAMAGRRFRDDVPDWLEQYNDLDYIKRILVGLMTTILSLAFLRFILESWTSKEMSLQPREIHVSLLALGGVLSLSAFLFALSRHE